MTLTPAVREALEYLDRGHCPVPLQAGTKVPLRGFDLTGWMSALPTEAAVRRAFAADRNLAVALGDVSDGLTVRDFDDLDAYARWADRFPALARRLPTVATHRGRHVYFTATASAAGGIRFCGDGELRRGGYVVAPSSRHPLGTPYRWLSPPDDFPFIADPFDAGLLPPSRVPGQGCSTRDKLVLQGTFAELETGAAGSWEAVTVEQAIQATQPTDIGQRHHRLFALTRMLRSIPETRDADPRRLRPIVRRWHQLALPRIGTPDFGETWRDFLNGWDHVRVPFGAAVRAVTAGATGEGIDGLEDTCRLLQLRAGDCPFFLDCRTAGELIGMSHTTARRWLGHLCEAGRLVRVTPGDRLGHRAAEYRYRGVPPRP